MNRYFCLLVLAAACSAQTKFRVEAFAGSNRNGDGGPATAAQTGVIQGVAVDRMGNVYLSDTDNHRVRKVAVSGIITTLAGTGAAGSGGDGGPATEAGLNLPYGLAVDIAGNIYVADLGNNRVRRISTDGRISTIAGTGTKGSMGDGGPAVEAQLATPRNVAVDSAGNIYISEFEGHRVRRITPDGRISTVAGTGAAGFLGDGGPASQAQLKYPAGLAIDRAGSLYIADSGNDRIRIIGPNGVIGSIGSGQIGPVGVAVDATGTVYAADSRPGISILSPSGPIPVTGDWTAPHDLAIDPAGNLYVADGMRVRRLIGGTTLQTIAGDAYKLALGDGGPATAAVLLKPTALAMDAAGRLLVADSGTGRIRQVAADGTIGSLVASLSNPMGVAADASGLIYIAETANHRIMQIGSAGMIRLFAGTSAAGAGAEGLDPLQTALNGPRAVCTGPTGMLYIVDSSNHRVLRISPGGLPALVAGSGVEGGAGDDGPARAAQLDSPGACTVDSRGNLLVADTNNNRIRIVTPEGIIRTIAGTGEAGSSGDGGRAIAARLHAPSGIAADSGGNIYISDTGNSRIRHITPDGIIHTVDTGGVLNGPMGIFLDGAGNLYVADTNNNLIRRLVAEGAAPPPIAAPVEEKPRQLKVVSAATLAAGPVAPGELVSILGDGLGPATAAKGEFDGSGMLPTTLGEVEVRFDGVPAALQAVAASQINLQVPYSVAGRAATHIEVLYRNATVGTLDVPVTAAAPALFGPILNPDGTTNSAENAIARGSIMSFYGTGAGLTDGAHISGQLALFPLTHPRLPVTVKIGGMPAEILYAGSAPGLVGTLQINTRVPGGFLPPGAATVELAVGTAAAPAVTIWVK